MEGADTGWWGSAVGTSVGAEGMGRDMGAARREAWAEARAR